MMDHRNFPGTADAAEQDYEKAHRALALEAGGDGAVLLKNRGILPLDPKEPVALFGMGAIATVKGGKGSGEVNARHTVTIREGLQSRGFSIANPRWLDACQQVWDRAREDWKQKIWEKVDSGQSTDCIMAYFVTPMEVPDCPPMPEPCCRTAVYVLCRTAGEGKDRELIPGDYYLSEGEKRDLRTLTEQYENLVLMLNTGGIVDLSILDELPGIGAVLLLSQPGMEAGLAAADLLRGEIAPSGHLTDTWPLNAGDHPCMGSENRGALKRGQVPYGEDIYVGYRYFDTFRRPVRFGFGYGLTYTAFRMEAGKPVQQGNQVLLPVTVTNTGSRAGRQVVQIYASCPGDSENQEFRRLAAFRKTGLLSPGEGCCLPVRIPLDRLTGWTKAGETLHRGTYVLWLGDSLEEARPIAGLTLGETLVLRPMTPLWEDVSLPEILRFPGSCRMEQVLRDLPEGALTELNPSLIRKEITKAAPVPHGENLSDSQLARLTVGGSWDSPECVHLGIAGEQVPGSAGETVPIPEARIPSMVLADGPAGLRLIDRYYVKDGAILMPPHELCMESGFLAREAYSPGGQAYYQYATAFPVGTALAQTWDPDLLRRVGQAVGREMQTFGVHLWLAPGMNIHRDPLCGRNFEYFSEDPLISGMMAGALTEGVQSVPGCGVTVKHFACNSQETLRTESDSCLTERALREIYLKGFEIAVRESQPAAIMTSYNLVNGTHSANNRKLCSEIARSQWGFRGLIMTDWCTTDSRRCGAAACLSAGNDLIMPGFARDYEEILKALEEGKLCREDLAASAGRILRLARFLGAGNIYGKGEAFSGNGQK